MFGKKPANGTVGWVDLTVKDAPAIRDFYQQIAGWKVGEVEMGGYTDFVMKTVSGHEVAGICHARGENVENPPLWIVYITVIDIEHTARRVLELGGKIRRSPTPRGDKGRFCLIEDPAGVICALFEPRS